MPISSLLPIGGAALGVLATRAISGLAQGLSFQSFLDESPADAAKSIPTVTEPQVDLESALPQFAQLLEGHLRSQGVDLSQPFTLKYDGFGNIVLDGDHPDRAAIEEALSQNAGLSNKFQDIATAAGRHRDPKSVAEVPDDFQLQFSGGTASIRFE